MGKSKLLDFSTMLVFWSLASLVRNSVVLAVNLLFSVACFFTVHEHCTWVVVAVTFQKVNHPHTPSPAPSAITSTCKVSIADVKKSIKIYETQTPETPYFVVPPQFKPGTDYIFQ